MNFNRLRTLACSLLLFSLPIFTFAGPVSKERAVRVAKNVLLEKSLTESSLKSGQSYSIKNILAEAKEGEDLIYIINFEDGGFAIISADDNTKAVLAYSTEGSIDKDNMPPQLEYFLEGYQMFVAKVKEGGVALKSDANADWDKYDTDEFTPSQLKTGAISPILTAKWGQSLSPGGTYWNSECPIDANGQQAITGCVATAMAQIMYHHAFPIFGTGASHSYYHPNYGTISASYTADYDWDNMEDVNATDASALLLFHVGVSVNMNYGPSSSGSNGNIGDDAYINMFGYSNDAAFASRASYTNSTWTSMLLSDLENDHPVYYQGLKATGGGHAFVLDGYDGSLFHINLGWNGSSNGYYSLDNILGYNYGQGAIFNVYPACQDNMTVTTNSSSGTKHYIATNTISASNDVSGTAKVAFRAGNEINLTTGFSVAAGSKFKALLKECNCSETTISSGSGSIADGGLIFESEGAESEITAEPTISIFPNPTKGKVLVKNIAEGNVIEVSAGNGIILLNAIAGGSSMELDLSDQPEGVYYLTVNSDSETTTEQIILSK